MSKWQQWLEPEEGGRPKGRKPDKNRFCRKNKNGGEYGPHTYEENGDVCIRCGHIKNKPKYTEIKEIENE